MLMIMTAYPHLARQKRNIAISRRTDEKSNLHSCIAGYLSKEDNCHVNGAISTGSTKAWMFTFGSLSIYNERIGNNLK